MKIVVTGASGNVGTAVLRELSNAGDVSAVAAVVRRAPRRTPPPPYDVATWTSVDIGAPNANAVIRDLTAAMTGAEAVIHLAWAIQPNHDREHLRRTNLLGTARVLAAARAAHVGHVVVASSVGAYLPSGDDELHDETWPIGGIPSSEYSVDKADLEQLLDEHEVEHPDVLITRLRPALTFHGDAASGIERYFLGRLVPPRALKGNLPFLAWPDHTRVQSVHAADVARAYLAAVRARAGGAFNIAADDVLRGEDVAGLLSGGVLRRVPTAAVRAAVSAGWHARALPVSPGWIDLAANVTLMSTAKASEVLDWRPTYTAVETVAEVLAGIVEGVGTASPPLRPR